MADLSEKDLLLQKYIEALTLRTPSNIINERGFDFTIGSPLRAMGEGLAAISSISQSTAEEEIKSNARDIMYILAGITTISESKANGEMSITSTQSITISAGEHVYSTVTGTKVAEALEDVSFTGAETKTVRIIADEAGADVSFAAGELFLIVDYQSGTNAAIINNGTDEETDYAKSQRLKDALLAKSTGTIQALKTAAYDVYLTDAYGAVTESVQYVDISFPWKHEDPSTLDPDRVGEIVVYVQSSIGVPSAELLAAIELALAGEDELDTNGKQGAGQNVSVNAVTEENIAFTVPYKKLTGYAHATITALVQAAITTYVQELNQGDPIKPTDWQAAIVGIEGVDYYDEANLVPNTLQEIDANKIWNITTITVSEI